MWIEVYEMFWKVDMISVQTQLSSVIVDECPGSR